MKAIVITTIFEPTEAIAKFSENTSYKVYVAGDKKTPENWNYPGTNYISVKEQEESNFRLSKIMPYNHYCRKMFGYLIAIKNGATVIVDTDDDNIPYVGWQSPAFEGNFKTVPGNKKFINIYQYFTKQKIWPRGLPLKEINSDNDWMNDITETRNKIGIWQGFADGEPDVDAIYRLTDGRSCYFEQKEPVVLGKNTFSPFNTQNTFIRKELFPLMYLPTYVTFRYTDILRGLIAQPIMWLYDYLLGFTSATVIQKRNPHDFYMDFLSEIPMYETTEKVTNIVSNTISGECDIFDNLHKAYIALLRAKIVDKREIFNLEAWIDDVKSVM